MVFHLYQDLFAPNGVRNETVPVTGGMQLTRVVGPGSRALGRATDDSSAAYQRFATLLYIRLPEPIVPGASATFEFGWTFLVTPDGAPRGGTDGEVFFVSYWYPQVAVYDDVNRWQDDPYKGTAEFYMGYANYDVALTVPAGWLIGRHGRAAEPGRRCCRPRRGTGWRSAADSHDIVHVVVTDARARGRQGDGTWRTTGASPGASAPRTCATSRSALSDQYLWDATTATVGDLNGDAPARPHR